jgi:hypothetical protein
VLTVANAIIFGVRLATEESFAISLLAMMICGIAMFYRIDMYAEDTATKQIDRAVELGYGEYVVEGKEAVLKLEPQIAYILSGNGEKE